MPGLRRSSVFEIPRHDNLKAKRFGATKAADHKLPYGSSRHSEHEAATACRERKRICRMERREGLSLRLILLAACKWVCDPSFRTFLLSISDISFGTRMACTPPRVAAVWLECSDQHFCCPRGESVQASAIIKHNLWVHRQGLWLESVTLAGLPRALARANPHKSYPDVVSPSGFLNFLLFFPAGPMDSPRRCFVPAVRV